MYNIYLFLILSSLLRIYGEEPKMIYFKPSRISQNHNYYAQCSPESETFEDGDTIRIQPSSDYQVRKSKCFFPDNPSNGIESHLTNEWYVDVNVTMKKMCLWRCILYYDTKTEVRPIATDEIEKLTYVNCTVDVKVRERKTIITFTIDDNKRCTPKIPGPIKIGKNFEIHIESYQFSLYGGRCFISGDGQEHDTLTFMKKNQNSLRKLKSEKELQFDSKMNNKTLYCMVDTHHREQSCSLMLNIKDNKISNNRTERRLAHNGDDNKNIKQQEDDKSNLYLALYIAGGVLVILIIIGQTVAVIYFKKKARANRLIRDQEWQARGSNYNRDDTTRYSATPMRRSPKTTIVDDTDSNIYEQVTENTMYCQESSTCVDIAKRPPQPLPKEMPVVPPAISSLPRPPKPKLMTSQPNLASSSSALHLIGSPLSVRRLPPSPALGLNKAPARPPKEISYVGATNSLRRLPKPPPAEPKSDTLPTIALSDPSFNELKEALKKRKACIPSPLTNEPMSSNAMTPELPPVTPQLNSPVMAPVKPPVMSSVILPVTSPVNMGKSKPPVAPKLKTVTPLPTKPKSPIPVPPKPIHPRPEKPLTPKSEFRNQIPQNPPVRPTQAVAPVPKQVSNAFASQLESVLKGPSQGVPSRFPKASQLSLPVPAMSAEVLPLSVATQSKCTPVKPVATVGQITTVPTPLTKTDTEYQDIEFTSEDEEDWIYEKLDQYNIYNM